MTENQTPLESWKEIAAYLQKDITTVRRWERTEGLPVHRHSHKSRSSVYAFPSEIDAWRVSRKAVPEPSPALPLWKTLLAPPRSLAFGVTLALCLVMVGNGVRPQVASAQSKQAARQVWTGAGVDNSGSASLDGRFLTLTDWATGDLAVRDLASGTIRRLTAQSAPYADGYAIASVPSPDAKLVAYSWVKRTGAELRVIGMGGSGPRVLYSNPEFSYLEAVGFSPDDAQILTRLNASNEADKIALISAANGKAQVLKTLPWGTLGRMSLSPDGRYIAYDFRPREGDSRTNIVLLATDASREVTLSETAVREQVFGWAPDGKTLLFASERSGSRDLWAMTVLDGKVQGQASLLRRAIGNAVPMGITRSGALFYAENTSATDVYVAAWDWETGKMLGEPKPVGQKVLGVNRDPVWAPDGRHLAYLSGVRGSVVITIANIESGEERQLSPGLSLIQRLTDWSPDGRSLLLVAFDQRNREGAYSVDVESGVARALVQAQSGQTIFAPEWLPDGKAIVYYRRDDTVPHSHLILHDIETDSEHELQTGQGDPGSLGTAVSPDGRRLAFRTGGGSERPVLGAVAVNGAAPRDLFRPEVPDGRVDLLGWSPDSRQVIFTTFRRIGLRNVNHELWRIPVEGGEPAKLVSDGPQSTFTFHPDGRRIAFASSRGSGWEVWALENFLPGPAGK